MFQETRAPRAVIDRPRPVPAPPVADQTAVPVTRVLVCDRLPIMREAMSGFVRQHSSLQVVGAADSVATALTVCRDKRPHVVLTSMDLGSMTGLQLIQRLRPEGRPDGPRVVFYTTSLNDHLLSDVLHAGASGMLAADATPDEFVAAIRAAADGHTTLAPHLLQRLIDWFRERSGRIGEEQSEATAALTSREREVLKLMALGRTMSQVARELCIELTTVRTHVYRMRCKLNIHDRAQLVSFAYRAGLM
jgi:DNA-binding NarL/FixJ family response regulator